jgi:2-polyprenyl-6-methoxyphenol hydroxylase-like FAD-dependent oxidoreductase
MKQFDVAVIGGGPAGCLAAAKLADTGAKVVLITNHRITNHRPNEIVSPRVLRLLSNADLAAPTTGCASCRGILSRWSHPAPQFHDFELTECSPALAVERQHFHHALVASLVGRNMTVLQDHQVLAIAYGDQRNSVHCRDGQDRSFDFYCRWIVDACGRGGSVCAPPQARRKFFDALVAASIPEKTGVAVDYLIVEASTSGWWYVGPSTGETNQLVFLTDRDLLPPPSRNRIRWLENEFCFTTLISSLGFGAVDFQTATLSDARFSLRASVWQGSWVAVGEAALALDPLSGLGTYVALAGSERVAMAVSQALQSADRSMLRDYVWWCQEEAKRQALIRRSIYRTARSPGEKSIFWQRRE